MKAASSRGRLKNGEWSASSSIDAAHQRRPRPLRVGSHGSIVGAHDVGARHGAPGRVGHDGIRHGAAHRSHPIHGECRERRAGAVEHQRPGRSGEVHDVVLAALHAGLELGEAPLARHGGRGLTGVRQAAGDEREVSGAVTGLGHREAAVAVADHVHGGVLRGGRDRTPDALHVVGVAGERQIDGSAVDAFGGELVHHQEPAPPVQVRAVHEQHRRRGRASHRPAVSPTAGEWRSPHPGPARAAWPTRHPDRCPACRRGR